MDWRSKDNFDEINEWACSAVTFACCPVHKLFERVELFKQFSGVDIIGSLSLNSSTKSGVY